MGNSQCIPHEHGENVKDFLRRKFSCVSRKCRIDDLVVLAIHDEEKEFKSVAGGVKFKKEDLARFYEERDALMDEFDANVMELEMYDFGHETPSEYSVSGGDSDSDSDSDSDESDHSKTPRNPPVLTPKVRMYADPAMQRRFDEYCNQAWDEELDLISFSDLPELDEYKYLTNKMLSHTKHQVNVKPAIGNGVCKQEEKNSQAKAPIDVKVKSSETPQSVAKIASEMAGGEKRRSCEDRSVHDACKNEVGEDGIGKAKKHHTMESNVEIGMATGTNARPTSQSLKRNPRFLDKITRGLRQGQGNQNRASSNLARRGSSPANGLPVKFSVSCDNGADVRLEKDALNHVSKDKKADKERGFFRRVVAKFRRRSSSSMSTNGVIHVQPKPDTDCMPPRGGMH